MQIYEIESSWEDKVGGNCTLKSRDCLVHGMRLPVPSSDSSCCESDSEEPVVHNLTVRARENHRALSSSFWELGSYHQKPVISLPYFHPFLTLVIVWSHMAALAHCPGAWLFEGTKPISRMAPGAWQFWSQALWSKAEILHYLIKRILPDFLLCWRQDSWAGETNMSQAPPAPHHQDRDGHSGIMPQLDTLNILVDKLEEINF